MSETRIFKKKNLDPNNTLARDLSQKTPCATLIVEASLSCNYFSMDLTIVGDLSQKTPCGALIALINSLTFFVKLGLLDGNQRSLQMEGRVASLET